MDCPLCTEETCGVDAIACIACVGSVFIRVVFFGKSLLKKLIESFGKIADPFSAIRACAVQLANVAVLKVVIT